MNCWCSAGEAFFFLVAGEAFKDSVRPAPGSDLPMLYLPQQRAVPHVQVTLQKNSKNLEIYLRHST